LTRGSRWIDTIPAIALPYVASAFGIFLLRPDLQDRAGASSTMRRGSKRHALQVLLKVYVPLARRSTSAYGLVSVSYHWTFPLAAIVTNSSRHGR